MRKILNIVSQNWIKYGFETIVVTVGILGAFTLESWKDHRQEEKELLKIYRTIADDLHTDSLALDQILASYEWNITIMKRILYEHVSTVDWIENDSLVSSFMGFPDFRESLRGLNLLKSKITTGGEAGILAGRISNFYNVRLLENSVTLNEVDGILYDNLQHWMVNDVWLGESLIEGDQTLLSEYVEDNPYFRNRIAVYLLVFNNHYRNLKRYKEEGTKLAEEIIAFLEK
jgi:hypothetical protein